VRNWLVPPSGPSQSGRIRPVFIHAEASPRARTSYVSSRIPVHTSEFQFIHRVSAEKSTVLRLDSISDPRVEERKIRRWKCGRIVMKDGKLVEIQHRMLCGNVSVAQVWLQAKFGRREDDCCWLDYHQPFGMPSFLTLDYIRTGTLASYKTFIGACHVLDEIARIRATSAIVAHVTNRNISDRLLRRHGWERHMEAWKGRHWIRRFYQGYPDSRVNRYVTGSTESTIDSLQPLTPTRLRSMPTALNQPMDENLENASR